MPARPNNTAAIERRIGWFSVALGITALITNSSGASFLALLFPTDQGHIVSAMMFILLGVGLNGASVLPVRRTRLAFLSVALVLWLFVAIAAVARGMIGPTACFAAVIVGDLILQIVRSVR